MYTVSIVNPVNPLEVYGSIEVSDNDIDRQRKELRWLEGSVTDYTTEDQPLAEYLSMKTTLVSFKWFNFPVNKVKRELRLCGVVAIEEVIHLGLCSKFNKADDYELKAARIDDLRRRNFFGKHVDKPTR